MNKILSKLAIPLDAIKQSILSDAAVIANKSVLNSPAKKGKVPKNGEVTLFGDFQWKPPITDAEEIQILKDGNWNPGILDFMAVTGLSPKFSIGNLEALLGEIGQYENNSIKRLNFFTHANSVTLGIAGSIDPSNISFDAYANEYTINYAADNYASIEHEGLSYKMDDIRKKFTEDGMVVLYACHLGANEELLKALANLFQAKVVGFKEAIVFCPPIQNNPPFKRKGMKIGLNKKPGGCPKNATVSDWKSLINDPSVIKVNPPGMEKPNVEELKLNPWGVF